MRILHFCNYADLIGGAEVYAHALIEASRARGHEVALFGASPAREVDIPGTRVIRRPLYDRALLVRDAAALDALKACIDRFRPEVLHVHNYFSVALEVIDHLGRCGVPLLQTVHDYQLLCPNSWCVRGDGTPCPGGAGAQCFQYDCGRNYPYDSWRVLLSALCQRVASATTSIAVAPSSHLAERLRANGWREVRHLPYFVDFSVDGSSSVERDAFELLYVGRLEREKGVDVLLSAMPEIVAAIPRVRLTLIGGGSTAAALRQQAEASKLGNAVRFVAKVPRRELSESYARAAACVLPSVWTENSPLVAYECLVAGLPILGSRIGGIPELVEPGCGLTFAPRDPADLARTVIRFLRLPLAERAQLSTTARQRALAHDKGVHLQRLEQFYREAISSRRPTDSATDVFRDLHPLLDHVGADLAGPRAAVTSLEFLRGIARGLGLPKILKDRNLI